MSSDVDAKTIKLTQDSLGKLIKKPALTDKLLKRPPFRFLHDIITNIIKTTEFMQGLYKPEEMTIENINDKEAKIAFLQKAIDVTEFVIGDTISAKPSKIVAGLEADKTNQWLQALAKAVNGKKDYKDAVEKVLRGEKIAKQKTTTQTNSNKKPEANISSKQKSTSQTSKKTEVNATKQSKPTAKRKDSLGEGKKEIKKEIKKETKEPKKETKEPKKETKEPKKETKEIKKETKTTTKRDISSQRKNSQSEVNGQVISNKKEEINHQSKPSLSKGRKESLTETPKPSSSKEKKETLNGTSKPSSSEKRKESLTETPKPSSSKEKNENLKPTSSKNKRENLKETVDLERQESNENMMKNGDASKEEILKQIVKDEQEKSKVNLKSARKPPKTEDSPNDIVQPTSKSNNIRSEMRSALNRPGSTRPPPPKVVTKHEIDEQRLIQEQEEKIKLQNVKPVSNLIVENSAKDQNQEDDSDFIIKDSKVRQIEDELIDNEPLGNNVQNSNNQKGSLVKQLVETKKELEGDQAEESSRNKVISKIAVRDIEKLKQSIQSLSKCINPLGRVLDYLQEDIDVMFAEMKSWSGEYKKNMINLEKERSNIDQDLEPLRNQLTQLDNEIEEQLEKISVVKANIIRNEERLHKMITTINSV